jgi:hypothetical protein
MNSIRIGYFLEDVAHREFIVHLVNRVASDMVGLPTAELEHDVFNASGGHGATKTELKRFLRDMQQGILSAPPILVVAIDGNCQGYVQKRSEITKVVQRYAYSGQLICAKPDPHIERWYIADPQAFQAAVESPAPPEIPAYKCERGRYKQAMNATLSGLGLQLLLGGAEFGQEIVAGMDLYTVQQADTTLKHFIEQLEAAFSPFVQK